MEALYYLNTRPDTLPPNDFLLTLTELVLSRNYFQCAGSHVLQKQGVSMGSSFAPSYACLTVGFWEDKFINNESKQYISLQDFTLEKIHG